MSFEKEDLRDIRSAITDALADVEEKFGITLSLGSIRYTDSSFHGQLKGELLGETGERVVPAHENMVANGQAASLGIPFEGANFIGNRYLVRGEEILVTGYNTKRGKYPVSGEKGERKIKFPLGYLIGSENLGIPTTTLPRPETISYEEFLAWALIDPDTDECTSLEKSQVETVCRYLFHGNDPEGAARLADAINDNIKAFKSAPEHIVRTEIYKLVVKGAFNQAIKKIEAL